MIERRYNPLKGVRLRLDMTHSELSALAGITVNAIVKNEHGLYATPSPKIIHALHEASDYAWWAEPGLMYQAYDEWRGDHLLLARQFFRLKTQVSGLVPSGGVNPFICWRVHHLHLSSRMEFCKLLVLHPAIVQKYEEGQSRQMPGSIAETLLFVGVTKESVHYLNSLGERYYDQRHISNSA